MKMLFITDLYPVDCNLEKTTPKTLYEFVQGWRKLGVSVDVIKPNFIFNSFIRGKKFYKTGSYDDVYNVNYWLPFMFDVKHKLVCNFDYDIVVAHMPSGILFADKLGIPFIAGVHNSDLEVLTNPLYSVYFKNRLKTALYNAKAIACRSFVIKKKLVKLFPDLEAKMFTAPSGIDEEFIIQRVPCQNTSKIKVLTCANFKKRKNIDKLIKACQVLESFELTVIGDGKERGQLEKISKNVIFTGRLDKKEVLLKMSDSDIFVLPSVNETFGMVYLEAMARGCITVCTKDDGIDGIIKDGVNGFLTYPNSESIKEVLLKIKALSQEELKSLSINSFHTIKNYTSSNVCNDYLQQILRFCKDLTL